MFQVSSDILALTSEALVLTRAGKVAFANAAAKAILGEDCVGRRLGCFFTPEILGAQASSFIADTIVNGERHIVRVARQENMDAIFITSAEMQPVMLNDALIYSMRSTLMTMAISTDICRVKAEELGDGELRAGIAAISQSHYRLTRLVENVSAAKEMLEGGLSFTPERVNLTALCRDCVQAVGMFAKEPEIVMGNAPDFYVVADVVLVRQMLLNVLSNCYVHAKGCTRISLNLIESGESVIISVTDNGCGIKNEDLHSVFSRYIYGFDMAGINGGAGLGLTVVRGIAERHGGVMMLESRENIGTAVRVSLRRNLNIPLGLHADEENYRVQAKDVLIGLADFLPASCYEDKYMD